MRDPTSQARWDDAGRVAFRPYTAAEILALFRAAHAAWPEAWRASPGSELTMNTTVSQWKAELDLSESASRLATDMGRIFGVSARRDEWRRVLEPAKSRTLRGVCEFIAARATVPVFEAVRVFGAEDRKAGVFLALKELLRARGVDVDDLRPSSPLTDHAERGFPELWNLLYRCRPRMDEVMKAKYRGEAGLMGLAVALLAATVTFGVIAYDSNPKVWLAALLAFTLFLVNWRVSERLHRRPVRVDFIGLTTFRDLCAHLAGPWEPGEPPRCVRCVYPLIGLSSRRCPECGHAFSAEEYGLTDAQLSRALEPVSRAPLEQAASSARVAARRE